MQTSERINNIVNYANFDNSVPRGAKFDSLDGGDDNELSNGGLVEMYKLHRTIFSMGQQRLTTYRAISQMCN